VTVVVEAPVSIVDVTVEFAGPPFLVGGVGRDVDVFEAAAVVVVVVVVDIVTKSFSICVNDDDDAAEENVVLELSES
jgi:hypothetical protein